MSTRRFIAVIGLMLGGVLGGTTAATAQIPPGGIRLELNYTHPSGGPAVLRQVGFNEWVCLIGATGQMFHYKEVERQPGYLELRGDYPGAFRVQIQANGALWIAPNEFTPLQYVTTGYLHTT
jgi:hypothetical protein